MTANQLEATLHREIPLSAAMGVSVLHADAALVRLGAPLDPNINHEGSAFGGSGAALAMLAGWSTVHLRMSGLAPGSRTVIHSQSMVFSRPIVTDFEAVCVAPPGAQWDRMDRAVARGRRGRIELTVRLVADGVEVGSFEGRYVVLTPEP